MSGELAAWFGGTSDVHRRQADVASCFGDE